LASWLEAVRQACASDPALALEIVRCRQLVKGYSDTHARGSSRFDQLMTAARALSGRRDAAGTLASLRDAAFKDASGQALQARWRALELPGSP
jgi:indolepyruvate ferredoxin oxidoreductase beta subunit